MIVEPLTFTTGSVHDSKMAQKLTKDIIGKAFADVGYQLKSEVLSEMAEDGVFMHNATRKNMNRLISKEQLDCLKQRNIIETVRSCNERSFRACLY